MRATPRYLLLLLLAAPPALADEPAPPDFWSELAEPGRKRFDDAIARGKMLLDRLKDHRFGRQDRLRRHHLEAALAAFREAVAADPKNPVGWYLTGSMLYELDRMKQAIRCLKKARQLASGTFKPFELASILGIAYSKVGEFENAVLEYDRADQVLVAGKYRHDTIRGEKARIHGNAAEALMALGRLDESIQRYREAISNDPSPLLRYGLAVAYDRDEQISKARQQMQKALAVDSKMRELTRDGVFFIPEGDIHYYFALGHETAGDLDRAKAEWEKFLSKLPKDQWAPRARAHLAALGAGERAESKPRGRLAPTPGPVTGNQEAGAQDRARIHARVRGYTYRLTRCYRRELHKQKGLTGRLRLAFTVKPNGRAENIRVVHKTVRRPALQACVVKVVQDIYFGRPLSDRAVRVEIPLEFKP
jgi:TonB family protein